MNFLPERLVMVDCEMTGVVASRDALLQVGMLKLLLNKDLMCYEQVDDDLLAYLHHDGEPTNDFQRKFLLPVYEQCKISTLKPNDLKTQIHNWLGDWKGEATPVGDCVPTDIAFLLANDCIDPCDYDDAGNSVKGTFHYEFFDLNAVKAIARSKVGDKFEIPGIDKDGVHDAIVDCNNQLLELNSFIEILLG